MEKKERILIVSVDRDNDLGEKAGISGPIIGRKDILQAALKLGLADPQDTDCNAIFEAARMNDEMRKSHETEVAVLTGDRDVGVVSDRKILGQLDQVLSRFKADYLVLVSDGTQDEQVTPILSSKVPILSVKRVVVKQAEQLESTYFKIKDFLTETLENPKFSRLVFGLPSIALILYALFGIEGWRIIVGLFGVYLFLKGFKLDDYIYRGFGELKTTLTRRRFAFFTYIVSIAFLIYATFRGYGFYVDWARIGLFESVAAFISASVYYYFLGAALAWVGRNIYLTKRSAKKIASMTIFGFAVALVVYNAAELILKQDIQVVNFMLSILFGFFLLFFAVYLEWKS